MADAGMVEAANPPTGNESNDNNSQDNNINNGSQTDGDNNGEDNGENNGDNDSGNGGGGSTRGGGEELEEIVMEDSGEENEDTGNNSFPEEYDPFADLFADDAHSEEDPNMQQAILASLFENEAPPTANERDLSPERLAARKRRNDLEYNELQFAMFLSEMDEHYRNSNVPVNSEDSVENSAQRVPGPISFANVGVEGCDTDGEVAVQEAPMAGTSGHPMDTSAPPPQNPSAAVEASGQASGGVSGSAVSPTQPPESGGAEVRVCESLRLSDVGDKVILRIFDVLMPGKVDDSRFVYGKRKAENLGAAHRDALSLATSCAQFYRLWKKSYHYSERKTILPHGPQKKKLKRSA